MTHRGRPVDPGRIKRVALLTIEGEHDDISGVGQTEAAHRLCVNIPADRQAHWLQPGVGHYGVFNGSRFRSEIAPRISDFVLSMSHANRAQRNGLASAAPTTAARCTTPDSRLPLSHFAASPGGKRQNAPFDRAKPVREQLTRRH